MRCASLATAPFAPDHVEIAGGSLRRWVASDAAALQNEIDTSRAHIGAWMPFANDDERTVAARQAWIESTADDWAAGSSYAYAVTAGSTIAGGCSLHSFADGGARLGYWIGQRYTERGLGRAAASGLVEVAVVLHLSWVEIRTDVANEPSRRIAERLGFEQLHAEPHSLDAPSQTGTSVVYRLKL